MKSTNKIAKEMGINPEDIEKRLSPEFTRQFGEHMEEKDGSVYFDAEVEEFLRLLFNKSDKPDKSISDWYAEILETSADTAGNEAEAAREEAALAKAPAQLPAVGWAELPAVGWAELPAVGVISAPLDYQPDMLVQAVEIQRQELTEFLNRFDQLVDYLAPDEWQRGRGRARGVKPAKRAIRLVGTT